MKVFLTTDEGFEVRPWGGRMCFLATEESAGSKLFGVTATLRMGQNLTHERHVHEELDEIILVLKGNGRQYFIDDKEEKAYDLNPGDLLYIVRNRWHKTDNASREEDLELFIINYFTEKQSDMTVPGYVPAGSGKTEEKEYGSARKVITAEVAGNEEVTAEFITIEPGKSYTAKVAATEEFTYVISGEAEIISGEEKIKLPVSSQAYFESGESYTILNNSAEPVNVFCMRAF